MKTLAEECKYFQSSCRTSNFSNSFMQNKKTPNELYKEEKDKWEVRISVAVFTNVRVPVAQVPYNALLYLVLLLSPVTQLTMVVEPPRVHLARFRERHVMPVTTLYLNNRATKRS